eukprot:TRINITY_DN136_c0_g1_i1.p1 TRINITY_DN136_c0_g1~~TRINITY_DN136_c0_g1_i1.p1  ORF type:complete len:110 (-),score=42.32 TRINITY_DN136_c0_g1_i1:274-603(-)
MSLSLEQIEEIFNFIEQQLDIPENMKLIEDAQAKSADVGAPAVGFLAIMETIIEILSPLLEQYDRTLDQVGLFGMIGEITRSCAQPSIPKEVRDRLAIITGRIMPRPSF